VNNQLVIQQPVPNPIAAGRGDAEIVAAVTALHASRDFSPYRNKSRCFNLQPLKKIRLYQSTTVNHNMVAFTSATQQHPNGRRIRKMCALVCSSTNRQRASSTQCATCKVALCSRRIKGTRSNGSTCFDKWHTCADIAREATRRREALGRSRTND
jgi:hypothetical protein